MRRHNINEINLQINCFSPFSNEEYTGIVIDWSSDIGFGEYTIYKKLGVNGWYADSETMDSNEDKAFITELMRLFVEELDIK